MSILVPYPAGGPSDYFARQLQPVASKHLGQTVVVENIGGASGTIGVTRALSAPADGQTVILGSPMELILAPMAIQGVRYKSEDLKLAAHIASTTTILAVRANLPGVQTVNDLITLARNSANRPLTYGSVGYGSLYHIAGEKFAQLARVPLTHVPYAGIAPLLTNLIGGHVDMAFLPMAGSVMQQIKDGKIRGLAVTARQPHPLFSSYPALAAMPGMEAMQFDIWAGVLVHKDVPDAAVQRISQAFTAAAQDPEVRKAFEATGNYLVPTRNLAELASFYRQEIDRYRTIAKAINLQAQATQ
ncbi:MAG: tripartite tricarboxylate transporter substrate binding protein [Casimicrobiaceae bacterium]|nr:tripartite tricarboxylate transporter substrate binding protein [Casimicrobiaceae bacterium]